MENGGEESGRGAARAARVFCRTIKSNRKRRGRRRTAAGFRPVVTGQLFSPAWRRYRTFSKYRVLPPHPLYLPLLITVIEGISQFFEIRKSVRNSSSPDSNLVVDYP